MGAVMGITLKFNGTRAELMAILHAIPSQLSGKKPDTSGAISMVWRKLAVRLQALVHDAYLKKSKGGTDDMGIQWPELKPATVKKRGSARPILIVTHRLLNSFLPDSPEGV